METYTTLLISRLLTLKEVAAELRVSQQWLKYWLVANPVDVVGVPFYVPMGSRKKFEPRDLDRIRALYMRDLEAARLGPSIQSKARLVGLMSQLGGGYDELVKMREADKRKKEAEKTKKPPLRRLRLPRLKPNIDK